MSVIRKVANEVGVGVAVWKEAEKWLQGKVGQKCDKLVFFFFFLWLFLMSCSVCIYLYNFLMCYISVPSFSFGIIVRNIHAVVRFWNNLH